MRSSGPTPTSWSYFVRASPSPARLQIASRVRLRPMAAASTTPASALNESSVGGRPPVEEPSSRSTTRPFAVNADTLAATAVRESPVRRRISARVVATPSRISVNTSPAVGGALYRLIMGIFLLKQDLAAISKERDVHHFDRKKT